MYDSILFERICAISLAFANGIVCQVNKVDNLSIRRGILMKRTILLLLLVILPIGLIIGCSRGEDEIAPEPIMTIEPPPEPEPQVEFEPQPEPQPEPEEEFRIIGEEIHGAYNVFWINRTGYNITGFAIKTSLEEEFAPCKLVSEGALENREIAKLFFTPPPRQDVNLNTRIEYIAKKVI
jgi:hypothetical protein